MERLKIRWFYYVTQPKFCTDILIKWRSYKGVYFSHFLLRELLKKVFIINTINDTSKAFRF